MVLSYIVCLNRCFSPHFSVISNCIGLLVQDLETACEPALTAMCKVREPVLSLNYEHGPT